MVKPEGCVWIGVCGTAGRDGLLQQPLWRGDSRKTWEAALCNKSKMEVFRVPGVGTRVDPGSSTGGWKEFCSLVFELAHKGERL